MVILRTYMRLIAPIILVFLFISQGGTAHAHHTHDEDYGQHYYIHKHISKTEGNDRHSQDHRQNLVLLFEADIAILALNVGVASSQQKHILGKKINDNSGSSAYIVCTEFIWPPPTGQALCQEFIFYCQKLFKSGHMRAPPPRL